MPLRIKLQKRCPNYAVIPLIQVLLGSLITRLFLIFLELLTSKKKVTQPIQSRRQSWKLVYVMSEGAVQTPITYGQCKAIKDESELLGSLSSISHLHPQKSYGLGVWLAKQDIPLSFTFSALIIPQTFLHISDTEFLFLDNESYTIRQRKSFGCGLLEHLPIILNILWLIQYKISNWLCKQAIN